MSYYLIFDTPGKYEWGYERIRASKDELKKYVGKSFVWVTGRDIDSTRGYAFPRYGKLTGFYRNKIVFDEITHISLNSIKEIGIRKEI